MLAVLAAWAACAMAAPAASAASSGAAAGAGAVNAIPRAASPESVGFATDRLQRLDRWLADEIAAGRKSGAVVLLARHGRIAWEKAYGYADLATRRPMRTDAMFRWYSMTKPVTSVALLTLFEEGRLQLTDPVARFVPAFGSVGVYTGTAADGHLEVHPPKRPVTVQDLMRHTAGLAYGGFFEDTPVDQAYQAAGMGYAQVDSVGEATERLSKMPLLYEPGERWVYSFASEVEARLVELLSGQRFDEYVRHTILEPLGMRDTVFGIPDERASRYPTVYRADPKGELQAEDAAADPYRYYTTHPFGGVSLSGTAQDYLRFAQMLLNGGTLGGRRILAPKTVELMASDHLPPDTAYWTPGVRFGLGVFVVTDPAQAGNLGSKGAYGWPGLLSTWVTIDPKEDLVALLFTQFTPRDLRFDDTFQTLVYQALVH